MLRQACAHTNMIPVQALDLLVRRLYLYLMYDPKSHFQAEISPRKSAKVHFRSIPEHKRNR